MATEMNTLNEQTLDVVPVTEQNDATLEAMTETAEKKAPIIKNMAEKILFDLGAWNFPASMWYKPQPYENRLPHDGVKEADRRRAKGQTCNVDFVPRPSHPDAPVRNYEIAESRQVLRRNARLAAKQYNSKAANLSRLTSAE